MLAPSHNLPAQAIALDDLLRTGAVVFVRVLRIELDVAPLVGAGHDREHTVLTAIPCVTVVEVFNIVFADYRAGEGFSFAPCEVRLVALNEKK